jgi:cytidylate kinase
LRRRDEIDSSRQHAPLKIAEDAVVINTDALTAAQVVDKIISLFPHPLSPIP